jgi:cystathionine gamma-synthase
MTDQQPQGLATRAIHAGQDPDPTTGSITPAIHQTSTFVQDGIGGLRGGYEYGRSGNPTRNAFEVQVAALEQGSAAVAFASGLAAEDALLRATLRPGDRVVLGDDAYGGTYRLLKRIHEPLGVILDTVDLTDPAAVEQALATPVRMLWVETPTNPLMKIADIRVLAAIGHEHGALVVVDNTFASPALQQPLLLGADVVVHSATKYLGGHSDALGGVVVTAAPELAERVRFLQFAAGAVLAPFEAWLLTRGIKTLDVRMQRHTENATAIARQLAEHPSVERVYYPGLPECDPRHLIGRQMSGPGAVLAVSLQGGYEAAARVAGACELITHAVSLGGVDSLIQHPASLTHRPVAGDAKPHASVLRLSIGLEDVDDLRADLDHALAASRDAHRSAAEPLIRAVAAKP